jgi:hypothetical protein
MRPHSLWLLALPLIVLIFAPSGDLAAKPKKPGSGTSCTCTCKSDAKDQTHSGVGISKWQSQVSFEETGGSCYSNNGGGCRVKRPDGSYAPGTMSGCLTKSAGAARSHVIETPKANAIRK